MSGVITAITVGAVATAAAGIGGAVIASNSAREAQQSQERLFEQALEEQRAANTQTQQTQQPYAQAGMGGVRGLEGYQQAGSDALAQQRALAGLDGPEAQRAAIAQIENSPQFAALMQQSEEAILANASATGGLRGGNVQGALAQNRQMLLSGLIDQQLGRLGGIAGAGLGAAGNIAGLGQASAAGQAASGLQGSQLVANLLGDLGASRAGGALAQGAAWQQGIGAAGQGIAGAAGQFGGLAMTGPRGPTSPFGGF